MPRVALAVTLLAAATALVGCKRDKPAPPVPPAPRVTVIRPVSVPVRDSWTYNGYLEQTKSVEVRSKVRGYLNGVKFAEGTEVTEGDLLYTLDKLEFNTAVTKAEAEEKKAEAEEKKAAAEAKGWEAQIVQARADLERISVAVNMGAESRDKLDLAQAALDVRIASRDAALAARDAAKGQFAAATAALKTTNIQLNYTDIKAKISGRISRTHADEGTLVLADTTHLTTILKVDQLYVYFDAPEADLIAFRHSDPFSEHIPVEVGVTGEEGYPHVGKIDFRENRVETATGTIRIRGIIDNPLLTKNVRQLFPGMYARVRVPKSAPVPQLVLPEDCLLSGQEGRFLYVVVTVTDDKGEKREVIQKRLVTVGATVWKSPPLVPGEAPPSWVAVNPKPEAPKEGQPPAPTRRTVRSVVAITTGLKPEDRVMLDGIQMVKPFEVELQPGQVLMRDLSEKLKPANLVRTEEWILTPPAEPKK